MWSWDHIQVHSYIILFLILLWNVLIIVFNCILEMVISRLFYNRHVKLPADNRTSPEICYNPKLYPFFRNCRGAVDGTHIDAIAHYHNRKGGLTQNVLAACTFDMQFCYVLSGWEGSAADRRVWDDVRQSDFAISPGTYYLTDAGFPTCWSLIIPYHGERYHLKAWGRGLHKWVKLLYCEHQMMLTPTYQDQGTTRNFSIFIIPQPETSLNIYSVL